MEQEILGFPTALCTMIDLVNSDDDNIAPNIETLHEQVSLEAGDYVGYYKLVKVEKVVKIEGVVVAPVFPKPKGKPKKK